MDDNVYDVTGMRCEGMDEDSDGGGGGGSEGCSGAGGEGGGRTVPEVLLRHK